MNKTQNSIFQLIRVSIGVEKCLAHTPSEIEWQNIYDYAEKQAIIGICFAGIEKLHMQRQLPPMDLFMKWLWQTEHIKSCNEHINEQTAIVWQRLTEADLKVAILKGQGIATLYGELCYYRSPGDIDVWVQGGFEIVNAYVQKTIPTTDFAYHRFHYDLFPDTEVELHHRPTLMRNLLDDKKLRTWCNSFSPDSFIYLDNGFAIPSLSFNRIFILTHIYRHFLFEGIGLRQLMDYYFVLRAERLTEHLKSETCALINEFRISRFAAGVMWIMNEYFGLPDVYLLCMPNVKEGQFILSEILSTGNFGRSESRYKGYTKFRRMVRHGSHLLTHYPSEVLWIPLWLVYHRLWRYSKLRHLSM